MTRAKDAQATKRSGESSWSFELSSTAMSVGRTDGPSAGVGEVQPVFNALYPVTHAVQADLLLGN